MVFFEFVSTFVYYTSSANHNDTRKHIDNDPQIPSVYLLGLLGLVQGNAPARTPRLLPALLRLGPLLLRPRLRLLEAGLEIARE